MNGYELDGRALSLGEAEQDKVIMQSFNVDRNILRGIILKKEKGAMNNEKKLLLLVLRES